MHQARHVFFPTTCQSRNLDLRVKQALAYRNLFEVLYLFFPTRCQSHFCKCIYADKLIWKIADTSLVWTRSYMCMLYIHHTHHFICTHRLQKKMTENTICWCIGYEWQGFSSGMLQGWLLWEEARSCLLLDTAGSNSRTQLSPSSKLVAPL